MKPEAQPSEHNLWGTFPGAQWASLSLRTKMALSFGSLFAVVLIVVSLFRTFGVPWTSDQGSYGDQRALVFRQLSLVADLKKQSVLQWLEERKSDAAALAQTDALVSFLREIRDVPRKDAGVGRSAAELSADLLKERSGSALTEALLAVARSHRAYRKIQLADADEGIIRASTDERDLGESVAGRRFFADALHGADTATVDVAHYRVTGKPHVVISHTITSRPPDNGSGEATLLGVVIMQADADRLFTPLVHIGGSIGESEEVVLVDHDRRPLTPLEHPRREDTDTNSADYGITAEPATLAAQGKEGILISRDYRGVSVLAAYRHIKVGPDSGWGMVVKVDQDEILGSTRRRVIYGSVTTLLGTLAAAMLAALLAGRIAQPIQKLSATAREVEAGDLGARAAVGSSDEVGNLAATFNSMIERVQNWHRDLETQVSDRTFRLTQLNEELTKEVTERRHAEERIRQQRNFLRTVLESLAYPFYVVNVADYTISMANSAALAGRTADGITCYALTHGRAEPCADSDHPCPLDEARRTGKPAAVEHVHFDLQGNNRCVEVHAYPIFDDDGNVAQVIEYSLDITDRKRGEAEREHLIAELEAKNTELERFAYTASHDLKSPLITIKGFLRYLEKDMASGNLERLRADSARIQRAVDKMSQLLDELLELSRIGRIMNAPQEIPLEKLVRSAIETLAGRIADRRAAVDIAENLPVLYGDAARLREVVENLLDNALKFMGHQPHPKIEISGHSEWDRNVISFKDNGIGIDPKYHQKIFGLFDRLDQDVEGTGIGLAIVRRIIEVHGGQIWVESDADGHGSVFSFTLPLRKEMKSNHS